MSKTCTFTSLSSVSTAGTANNSPSFTITEQGLISAVSQNAIVLPPAFQQNCIVYNTTGTALAGGSISTFNTVVSDLLGMFNGSNTITVPVAGTYQISHRATSTATALASRLSINGGAALYLWIGAEPPTTPSYQSGIAVFLAAGSTIRQECYAGSYTQTTAPYSNMISVTRLW